MKTFRLLMFGILFFLIINTSYFWEASLGLFAIPIFILLVIFYIILTLVLLRHVYVLIKEKFIDKKRLATVATLIAVLGLIFYKPMGLINFEKFEASNILVAGREGVASCYTKFQLKTDKTFRLKSICFGIDEETGNYIYKNDTIFFTKNKRGDMPSYEFGIIKKSIFTSPSISQDVVLFENKSDTIGFILPISKNELENIDSNLPL